MESPTMMCDLWMPGLRGVARIIIATSDPDQLVHRPPLHFPPALLLLL